MTATSTTQETSKHGKLLLNMFGYEEGFYVTPPVGSVVNLVGLAHRRKHLDEFLGVKIFKVK